jgi:hypothetical protein
MSGEGIGDCRLCGHAIGYNHAGTEEQTHCTVMGCSCPGYDDAKQVLIRRGDLGDITPG